MNKKDWNPQAYLQFNKERLLPSYDLANRIENKNAKNIIDVGCGPGNSTQVLVNKWPNAKILGIDSSPSMIDKARSDYPEQLWEVADITKFKPDCKFDVVFSNATIQWISNHKDLFGKFKSMMTNSGVLAIQLPRFSDMALAISIDRISKLKKWMNQIGHIANTFRIESTVQYYDYLSPLFTNVEMWETHYTHVMESHQAIFDMIFTTGLRPYLLALPTDAEIAEFKEMVYNSIVSDYPSQKDGKVLFPFKRQFLIAKN